MSTVPIGPAAALYEVATSTLRWWEREGVLGTDRGADGRRRYGEEELRLIGFAYLRHVVGLMPLDKTAIVVSAAVEREKWQQTVTEEIAALAARIDDLTAAREYLQHLLTCTSDPPVDCPHLDAELIRRTPAGCFPTATNLTTAAHEAAH
ncbi:MerR family transcriptional regulator [Kribbella solani]|uniref:helix-turn-helix domain-containing protein n=1 Tax=Kribbella solani TaxID=236067 RepID=UPI00160B2C22|nr:MerR family transcriptional regulator [Kribbella solani]